jgi:hypothetical protein
MLVTYKRSRIAVRRTVTPVIDEPTVVLLTAILPCVVYAQHMTETAHSPTWRCYRPETGESI